MDTEIKSLANVTDASIQEATGKTWREWITFLDNRNADQLSHRELVALLNKQISMTWWCQKIALGYQQFKGKRITGQTQNGFQMGVMTTLPLPVDKAWELITSEPGMEIWLGKPKHEKLAESKGYITESGISGQINVLKNLSHIRLTWQPPYWQQPSTLQVRVIPNGPKTSISFHHEGLPASEDRERMKAHWKQVLDDLARLIAEL